MPTTNTKPMPDAVRAMHDREPFCRMSEEAFEAAFNEQGFAMFFSSGTSFPGTLLEEFCDYYNIDKKALAEALVASRRTLYLWIATDNLILRPRFLERLKLLAHRLHAYRIQYGFEGRLSSLGGIKGKAERDVLFARRLLVDRARYAADRKRRQQVVGWKIISSESSSTEDAADFRHLASCKIEIPQDFQQRFNDYYDSISDHLLGVPTISAFIVKALEDKTREFESMINPDFIEGTINLLKDDIAKLAAYLHSMRERIYALQRYSTSSEADNAPAPDFTDKFFDFVSASYSEICHMRSKILAFERTLPLKDDHSDAEKPDENAEIS